MRLAACGGLACAARAEATQSSQRMPPTDAASCVGTLHSLIQNRGRSDMSRAGSRAQALSAGKRSRSAFVDTISCVGAGHPPGMPVHPIPRDRCCETKHQIGDGTDDVYVSPSPRHLRLVRDVRASLAGALLQGRPSVSSPLSLACGCPAPRPTQRVIPLVACLRVPCSKADIAPSLACALVFRVGAPLACALFQPRAAGPL